MKRYHSILLLSVAVFAAGAAAAVSFSTTTRANPAAHEDEDAPCTLASAKGSYGFVESGTIIGLGPYVSCGIFISDGEGGAKGVFAENAAGALTFGIAFASSPVEGFTSNEPKLTLGCGESLDISDPFLDCGEKTHCNTATARQIDNSLKIMDARTYT